MSLRRLHFKRIFILLYICTSFVNAQQQDSLVDVFPLAIGNKWVYQYYFYHHDYFELPITKTDSGNIKVEIIGNSTNHDTLVWHMQEHQTYHHQEGFFPGAGTDTAYDVDNIVAYDLYEIQSGQHCLFGGYYPAMVFRFTDTGRVYHYQPVDTAGNVKAIADQYLNWTYHQLTFKRDEGMVSDTFWNVPYGRIDKYINLIGSTLVSVNESNASVPTQMMLFQNYPNPFNPSTTIEYHVPSVEFVRLRIYNVLGEEVATLVNERKSPGTYTVQWDGFQYPSGIYFYKMAAGEFVSVKKMLLMK